MWDKRASFFAFCIVCCSRRLVFTTEFVQKITLYILNAFVATTINSLYFSAKCVFFVYTSGVSFSIAMGAYGCLTFPNHRLPYVVFCALFDHFNLTFRVIFHHGLLNLLRDALGWKFGVAHGSATPYALLPHLANVRGWPHVQHNVLQTLVIVVAERGFGNVHLSIGAHSNSDLKW